ncbi:MAG TPA: hypothetical protein VFX45_12195 [Solirubrobacterales bacterium]|nr:hypothetical protein [Solirubrobacterales bacterium]
MTGLAIRILVALISVVVVVTVFSACGSGSSSGDTTENGEPSAAFAGKGENGELATAGTESTVEEREAASKVVEESLEARAEGDFETQCRTLSPELVKQLEERGSKGIVQQNCVESLETLARNAPQAIFENVMTEPLAALRVNGTLAFAFFHGARGNNYVVPMEKEGTEWKVGSLQIQETP